MADRPAPGGQIQFLDGHGTQPDLARVGGKNRSISEKMAVLPPPLGPTMATVSPGLTVKSISRRTGLLPDSRPFRQKIK
ncbi:MAG: hypothetical protein WBP80_14625 [Planifilum fulgidum]